MMRNAGSTISRSMSVEQRRVHDAAEVAGERADDGRQRRGHQRTEQPDDQRLLHAAHRQREHVEPVLRRAEPVRAARRLEEGVEVELGCTARD